jgi:hypothetical protein
MKTAVAHLKTRLSSLGYSVGPIILLLVGATTGFLNPQSLDNNDFVFSILFCGIIWLLVYGADPLRKAGASTVNDKKPGIKPLKPSVSSIKMRSDE